MSNVPVQKPKPKPVPVPEISNRVNKPEDGNRVDRVKNAVNTMNSVDSINPTDSTNSINSITIPSYPRDCILLCMPKDIDSIGTALFTLARWLKIDFAMEYADAIKIRDDWKRCVEEQGRELISDDDADVKFDTAWRTCKMAKSGKKIQELALAYIMENPEVAPERYLNKPTPAIIYHLCKRLAFLQQGEFKCPCVAVGHLLNMNPRTIDACLKDMEKADLIWCKRRGHRQNANGPGEASKYAWGPNPNKNAGLNKE